MMTHFIIDAVESPHKLEKYPILCPFEDLSWQALWNLGCVGQVLSLGTGPPKFPKKTCRMCSTPTRICIEKTILEPGTLEIYYPANLIPVQSRQLLELVMYRGGIPTACSYSDIDRIITYEVKNTSSLNEFVNATTVMLPTISNGSYYFQLQDLSSTICMLGPDLFGSRVPFVNYIAPSPSVTPPISTYSALPDLPSTSWLEQSAFLIITFIILVACTIIGFIIYFVKRERKSFYPYYENQSPASASIDTIIRVHNEPELTQFAKQLIDGNVRQEDTVSTHSNSFKSAKSNLEGASTDSASFVSAESRIRISSSYGSMSFKTAEDYTDSDESWSLNIDDLFIDDDHASTLTIKAQ
jgi:hypothetical protein